MIPWLVRRTRAESLGQCVRCGGELDAEGGCPGCTEAYTTKQEVRREEYAEAGLCRCGRPRAEARKQCPACLAADRDYKRTAWANGTRPAMRPVAVRGGQGHEGARRVEQGLMDRATRREP